MFPTRTVRFLFLVSLPMLILGCQENKAVEDVEVQDQDMINAIDMAENYMNTKVPAGRRDSPMAVTVLQYKDGVLYYSTNTDMIRGYNVVNEETITAYVQPGEFIFWVTGAGVTYLDGIEFDIVAEYQLRGRAEEGEPYKMWLVRVPENIETNQDGELKYDIIYTSKDNDGNPIRLDPKLKIQ